MKSYRHFFTTGLLAGAATTAHAQTTPLLRATLDTVAVTGTTRVLTLAAAPGPDLPGFPMTPNTQKAVFYAQPSSEHEYDLTAIRVLVSEGFNRSSTGRVFIDLVLPDSSTHGPSTRHLLPTPLVITDREVRKAKKELITLDLRPYHLAIPASGIFVLASGQAPIGEKHMGDTLVQRHKGDNIHRGAVYVKLTNQAHPTSLRVVNATDFICIRDIRTASQPQTWDYNNRLMAWQQRKAAYAHCPQCVISNAGLELVVREL